MNVSEIMVRDVGACESDTNLESIAKVMWEKNIGSVPVVDGNGSPTGIVTDRDISMCAALTHKPLWDLKASELTGDRHVYTCKADDDIRLAMKTMWAQKVRRLPVVDNEGHLLGILSIDDIIQHAERGARGESLPDVSYDDTVNTLKGIAHYH